MQRHAWIIGLVLASAGLALTAPASAKPPEKRPNILLFILDDVGIDQMTSFGYGGATAPRTPSIDTIASEGVRFRNLWTMPECSPSRAMLFEGRYPLRTNVYSAILPADLANSQVPPYETTTPRILRGAGYTSALFGKFHLAGSDLNPDNNPLGYTAVRQLGWDYFAGWQDGAPHPIDTTAGGVAAFCVGGSSPGKACMPNQNDCPPDNEGNPGSCGPHSCGFVPNTTDDPTNGADSGACYFVNQPCSPISRSTLVPTPGRTCMERGGVLVPNATCASAPPAAVNFGLQNAYYAGQLVINQPDGSYQVLPPQDPSGAGRGYRTVLESQRAIDWINARSSAAPWMATVSYSSAHTPYQQPPTSLLPVVSVPTGGADCLKLADQRVLSNQMIESMDREIGRVLVDTGLATRNLDGSLNYSPAATDTMIVILGDNGTYAPAVKAPFNPLRAKGSVYQTGVWTPLIVAGPLVQSPGRQVDAMVNVADVFELFGEIAGLDVHKIVPKSRPLDSVSMLPYLTNPQQKSLRSTSFTQTALNIRKKGYLTPPCVLTSFNTCIDLVTAQAECTVEEGTWWGDGGDVPGAPQPDCCRVNQYRVSQSEEPYNVLPDWQMAIRDDTYKLVKQQITDYNTSTMGCETTEFTEFYAIDEAVPPRLDDKPFNLLAPGHTLTKAEEKAFAKLSTELDKLLASQKPCPGDGNRDGVVDQEDIDQLDYWESTTGGNSSWYDFNQDSLTNQCDVPYITEGKFPRKCPRSK
jgi:Sulfatase